MATPSILIVAGTDSSGGAGLLRDAAVARDLGLHARCVVTAVTAQTDAAVTRTQAMPADIVSAQLQAALSGDPPGAVKIGMLATAEVVRAVAAALAGRGIPVVLDPVLAATAGGALLNSDGVAALRRDLLPLCTLITPNLPEAAALAGPAADSPAQQAAQLRGLGAGAVLIKGGHAQGAQATDLLFDAAGCHRMSAARLPVGRRGTGCTLSTAIACFLAAGRDLRPACDAAKQVTHRWIAGGAGSAGGDGNLW